MPPSFNGIETPAILMLAIGFILATITAQERERLAKEVNLYLPSSGLNLCAIS
jgi:hypothetical protein